MQPVCEAPLGKPRIMGRQKGIGTLINMSVYPDCTLVYVLWMYVTINVYLCVFVLHNKTQDYTHSVSSTNRTFVWMDPEKKGDEGVQTIMLGAAGGQPNQRNWCVCVCSGCGCVWGWISECGCGCGWRWWGVWCVCLSIDLSTL
jgi:hypothetical protein